MLQPPDLLNLLPSIFHKSDILKILLEVFSRIMISNHNSDVKTQAISQHTDALTDICFPQSFFWKKQKNDPFPGFLDWIASWVAFTLNQNWDFQKKSRVLSQIIPLIKMRGTRLGMRKLLSIFCDISMEKIIICTEESELAKIGTARIGSILLGDKPRIDEFYLFILEENVDIQQAEKIIREEMPANSVCIYNINQIRGQIPKEEEL